MDPIRALRESDGFLRPPGKPHAKLCIFMEHCNVKARAVLASENGVFWKLLPPGCRLLSRAACKAPARRYGAQTCRSE